MKQGKIMKWGRNKLIMKINKIREKKFADWTSA